MQQIKLSECKEGDKICLPSWQNGQKYRVVYWVEEPTSVVKYHTKVDEKGVKKRHKISIPAVWVSHLEKGEVKLIREKRDRLRKWWRYGRNGRLPSSADSRTPRTG